MQKVKIILYTLLPVAVLGVSMFSVLPVMQRENDIKNNTPRRDFEFEEATLTSVSMPSRGGDLQFGMFTPDFPPERNLIDIENDLNRKLNILSWYHDWEDELDTNKLEYACENGYIPQITWETWAGGDASQYNPEDVYPLSELNAGTYDEYIERQFEAIATLCDQTVIIRFNHEMDGYEGGAPWYPWQMQPEEYKLAWKRMVTLASESDADIAWLWSPNRGSDYSLQYYPGDEWVDYVGLTLNRSAMQGEGDTFEEFYNLNATIESLGKPIIIGETTVNEGDPDFKSTWVRDMFEFARNNPKIVALVWFNKENPQGYEYIDYRYNSSESSRRAFIDSLGGER